MAWAFVHKFVTSMFPLSGEGSTYYNAIAHTCLVTVAVYKCHVYPFGTITDLMR